MYGKGFEECRSGRIVRILASITFFMYALLGEKYNEKTFLSNLLQQSDISAIHQTLFALSATVLTD
jgi:hypothetical protein